MSGKEQKHEKIALSALLLAAVIWGSGFVATRLALDAGFGIAWIMLSRFLGTSIIFAFIFKKDLTFKRQELLLGGLTGFILFVAFSLQILGLQFTTPARNAFITATYVVLVPFLSWLISKQRPSWHVFSSAFFCLGGIGILSMNGAAGSGSIWGDFLTLLAAISFAAHFITLENAVHKMSLGRLLFLQMAVVSLCSTIFLPFDRYNQLPASGPGNSWLVGLAAIVYMTLFCSGLAYVIQTSAQKYTSSAKAALILSAEALWGSLFSILFGYEAVSWRLVLGGILIITAVILTELPALNRQNKLTTQSEEGK